MDPEEKYDRPEEVPEAVSALTSALAAASPHRPPAELRERVIHNAVRGTRLTGPWPYAAVAAIAAVLAGTLTWALVANQQVAAARRDNPDLAKLEATNEVVFDVITCKGGHVAILRATQPGSMSYGKLYTCAASYEVVFMSGKLQAPPSGKEYELWLTSDGQALLQGPLKVWPSLAGPGYYFGSITFKSRQQGLTYQLAQLTLQSPGGNSPESPVVAWSGS